MDLNNNLENPEAIGEEEFKLDGPLKRNLHIILPVVLGFVVAPPLTHLMASYRAIVLNRNDSELLVMKKDRPPETVDMMDILPGQMICKESGSWSVQSCTAKEEDAPLEKLYLRYTRAFVGKIVGINPPVVPGGASSAIVLLANKEKIEIELWAQHLAGAKVGLGLKKIAQSWEPKLIGDPFSGNIQFQTPRGDVQNVAEKNALEP